MTNKQLSRNLIYSILTLILLVIVITSGQKILPAFAINTEYTGALEDLQKSEDFNAEEYQEKADDYSLQVIQIAEGAKNELFVYVFQPSFTALGTPLFATCLNMSLTNDITDTALYDLTFCNSDGAFHKYVTNNITVSETEERFYIITSVYRAWNERLDNPPEGDNTITEVAFEVGRFYTVTTNADGSRNYAYQKQEAVTITEKFVGYLEYNDGFKWLQDKHCRSHYVAFSTDWKINELYEAEIAYEGTTHNISTIMGEVLDFSLPLKDKKIINYLDTGENDANWFLGKKYSWKRIEKVSEFITDPINQLKPEALENINSKQWVFRFLETTVNNSGAGQNLNASFTNITDVTILRLKFLSGITVYNLGVVDNKQTGGNTPGNTNTDELAGFFEWLARMLGIPEWLTIVLFVFLILILVAIALFILSFFFPLFGIILRFAGLGIAWFFKGLIWLVCLPFKGVVALIKKIKNSRSNKADVQSTKPKNKVKTSKTTKIKKYRPKKYKRK